MKPIDFSQKGYKEYPQPFEWPYTFKTLWQRHVESPKVCETSNRLSINITVAAFDNHDPSYTIDITAEQNSIWWKVEAYSLSHEEVTERLYSIENTLVKMFNVIMPVVNNP